MKTNRPYTTLFMLMSVDGKISTGDSYELDFDRDLPKIKRVKEGLQQYYDLERQTDLFSLNTGKVMAKIGVNSRTDEPKKSPASFVIIDNKPHVTEKGVEFLAKWVNVLYLVTTNDNHPALAYNADNIHVIKYENNIDFADLFCKLKEEHGVDYLTVQSGGTLNAKLLQQGLIDRLSIIVAPIVIGGKNTPTLVDGESLHQVEELPNVKTLQLIESNVLEDSYLHLTYKVISETELV